MCQHFRNADTRVRSEKSIRTERVSEWLADFTEAKRVSIHRNTGKAKSEKIFWPNCNVQLKHASFIPTTQHAMFEKIFFDKVESKKFCELLYVKNIFVFVSHFARAALVNYSHRRLQLRACALVNYARASMQALTTTRDAPQKIGNPILPCRK